jgi:predicted Zn-dependent protease with MMP-like domain
MTRERFASIVEEVLERLPSQFQQRIHNVAVLVEDYPPEQRARRPGLPPRPKRLAGDRRLKLGVFVGVPATQKSVFDLSRGPDYVVLYQKNIEAVSRGERDLRDQIRRTVIHELGHYFGLDESQLSDV